MKTTKYLVLVVHALCLTACIPTRSLPVAPAATPDNALGDGGLISGEPCGPPCFWGIVPDVSGKEDIEKSLADARIYDMCTFEHAIYCRPLRLTIEMNMWNTVRDINFEPANIKLGEVIEKHGAPDGLWFMCAQSDSGHLECPPIKASVYYEGLKMIVNLDYQDNSMTYWVAEDSTIISVRYTMYLTQDRVAEFPWQGYGSYTVE